MSGRPPFALLFITLLCGCGRYRDFTLPEQPGGPSVHWKWQARAEPVLTRGAAGTWDSVDVLNPSVIRQGGAYYNLFSGYDGKTWHTGLAASADGIAWRNERLILSPESGTWEAGAIAANGAAVSEQSGILYYYQAGAPPRIGLATFRNWREYSRHPVPVLPLGPYGSWDERGVADPYVIRAGENYYMFYLGQDRARRQRIGVAQSRDGVTWYKLRANPVLELGEYGAFDANGLGEPAVWATLGYYWMLYTGRDAGEMRRLGLARSRDGVHWEKTPMVIAGDQAWDSKVICDPTVIAHNDRVTVWFGGGDIAAPDQNVHGQIGAGELVAASN
ncbi:MAG TPA: hypothetical protein VME17_04070 [Bryobacteraceae bacterium]|nr:hypothetical protein [Bryobacteraceae bacterium]